MFLKGYDKQIRQVIITGHMKINPAMIITNDSAFCYMNLWLERNRWKIRTIPIQISIGAILGKWRSKYWIAIFAMNIRKWRLYLRDWIDPAITFTNFSNKKMPLLSIIVPKESIEMWRWNRKSQLCLSLNKGYNPMG